MTTKITIIEAVDWDEMNPGWKDRGDFSSTQQIEHQDALERIYGTFLAAYDWADIMTRTPEDRHFNIQSSPSRQDYIEFAPPMADPNAVLAAFKPIDQYVNNVMLDQGHEDDFFHEGANEHSFNYGVHGRQSWQELKESIGVEAHRAANSGWSQLAILGENLAAAM